MKEHFHHTGPSPVRVHEQFLDFGLAAAWHSVLSWAPAEDGAHE